MSNVPATVEPPLSRGARLGAVAAIVALFAALRLLHLVWRPPFFDELFTVWIASLHPGEFAAALASDSGPPLYYLAVHLLTIGHASVTAARLVSFAAACGLLAAILVTKRLGRAALVAALLLALFAPHVHFSVEGRAYALAGTLAGAGCLALAEWAAGGRRSRLALGTALLVGAAAAHYYGVLFFAIPFALGLLARTRRAIVEGTAASAAAGVVFIPGFILASRQPPESIAWMRLVGHAPAPLEPLRQLAFVADYPPVFIAPPPEWVPIVALAATLLIVVPGLRSAEARRWGVITLVPVVLAVAFGLAGASVYFPVRFEAVLAAPFACWLAVSLLAMRNVWLRSAATILLVALGLVASYTGIMTSLARRPDAWREAATFVRRTVPASMPIVASGYGYLEVLGQRDAAWYPRVRGFPAGIETHPGWVDAAAREPEPGTLPAVPFVWVGQRHSPEHRALARGFGLRPLMVGRGMIVAEAVEDRKNRTTRTTRTTKTTRTPGP